MIWLLMPLWSKQLLKDNENSGERNGNKQFFQVINRNHNKEA
jgi:hypothetical protein